MSILYIVATPIGNLDDMTFRAVEVLRGVDVIACEDTRHTLKLLNRYGIKKRLLSYHAHNEEESANGLVKLLIEGKNIAYVSDAGTPGLSDPGCVLVGKAREAGIKVVPIPGACAFSVLMSAAGFSAKDTVFVGFLSPKQGKRKKRLAELLEREEGFVLYESPYRIVKLLHDLADLEGERKVLVGREMTKIHEEFIEGSAHEVLLNLEARKNIAGEFSLLVYPAKKS